MAWNSRRSPTISLPGTKQGFASSIEVFRHPGSKVSGGTITPSQIVHTHAPVALERRRGREGGPSAYRDRRRWKNDR
jgi:hypothetical protein